MDVDLLILVLFCSGLLGAAQFTERPRNLVVRSNTAVTLVCETDPTSSSRNIVWSRSDGIDNFVIIAIDGSIEPGFEGRYSVVYQSRTGVGSPTTSRSELTIEDVQAREAGTYRCTYLNNEAYSQLIVIESEPQTNSNVTLDEVIEGEYIGLSCFVSYSSAISWSPRILWLEASAGILPTIDQSTAGEARFVYAAPVLRTDHGNSYQCTAEWGVIPQDEIPEAIRGDHDLDEPDYSFASNVLGLSVLYPAENLDISSRKSVYNPGESIAITAAGRPDVNFRWQSLIDNTTIEEPVLPITAEMEGLQNWMYSAYNTIRGQRYELSDSISFLVEVPTTTPTPPTVSTTPKNPSTTSVPIADLFRERPRNSVVQTCQAALLNCETEVTLSPRNILWLHSDGIDNFEEIAIDGIIKPGLEDKYSVSFEGRTSESTSRSEFTIIGVQERDAGTYECRLVTGSAYAQMIVMAADDELFRERPRNSVVQTGQAAQLNCETEATVSPRNILWLHSGGIANFEEIAIDGVIKPGLEDKYSVSYAGRTSESTSRSEFTIKNAHETDAGTYKCHLVTGSAYAQLVVVAPDIPTATVKERSPRPSKLTRMLQQAPQQP